MPQLTRRSALVLGGALGLAALSRPVSAATASSVGPGQSAQIPLRPGFARATGTIVTARAGQHSYRLRLTEILDLGPRNKFDPSRCFNLIFDNAGSAELPEGIYQLSSARLPATSLLLSPTGRRVAVQQLQAVINRSA